MSEGMFIAKDGKMWVKDLASGESVELLVGAEIEVQYGECWLVGMLWKDQEHPILRSKFEEESYIGMVVGMWMRMP